MFLWLLLIAVFILVPLADREGMLFASAGFSVLLIAGVLLVAKNRMTRGLVTVTALITLTIHWVQHVVPGTGLASMSALASIGFLALLACLVFLEVLKKGPITLHRVQGAVAVYLLFGLIWAFAYDLVILHAPQAFHADELTVQHGPLTPTLIYFSFTTLTTVGYGDITPIHPIARSLAMLEAFVGQLFPAILIARLVAMELQYRQTR